MLNCSFSCIALQSGITQHSIKFLVTAITGLSVAQPQFSVLRSAFYRTNWSLFLFEEHWPISWTLPIRVKQGAFHHLPFLWTALCSIIKFVLAGNWVIHSFLLWYTTVDGRSKWGAGLSSSVLWCYLSRRNRVIFKLRFIMALNLYHPLELMMHCSPVWSDRQEITAQPLKHFLPL